MKNKSVMENSEVDSIENDMEISVKSHQSIRRKCHDSPKDISSILQENDDEAELSSRRKSLLYKRKSLGIGRVAQMPRNQMEEHIKLCIKLNAENKINIKNAFSLEAIDILTCMVKQHNSELSNLQVASSSLDVSSKIYGFRVDCVHTEVLKMMGVLDKQEKKDEQNSEQNENGKKKQNDSHLENQKTKTKKKKRSQKVLTTEESLKGIVEVTTPASLMMQEGDPQTSDLLYQTVLPLKANSNYYLLCSDETALDELPENKATSQKTLPNIKLHDIENFEIFPGFTDFQFEDWSVEDEDVAKAPVELGDNTILQFDLDASLPLDDNNFNTQDDGFEDNGFEENSAQASAFFCRSIASNLHNKSFEYSYMHKSDIIHWAGPSYWKIKVQNKNTNSSKVVETCGNIKQKKKDIEMEFSKDHIKECKKLFKESRSTMLVQKTLKSWLPEKLILLDDTTHDLKQTFRFYLRPETNAKVIGESNVNTTHFSDDDEIVYDYNNEHDVSEFCPNVNTDEENDNGDNNLNEFDRFRQGPLTGDNLVSAPDLVADTYISYSRKAKKIDVRQLKKSIWQSLAESSKNDETVNEQVLTAEKNFSNIYQELPKLLTKSNLEALSIPVAFVSLLHLANEKTLVVKSIMNFTDLHVAKD